MNNLFIVIIVLIIILIILSSYIILHYDNCNNNHIETFTDMNYDKINIGPFKLPILKKNYYVFNPSIILYNNQIKCIARLTDYKSNICEKNTIVYKYDSIIEQKLKIFKDTYKYSALLYFNLFNDYDYDIINLFKEENICKDNDTFQQGIEDPRLFIFKKDLYIYGHYRGLYNNKCTHIPIICKINTPNNIIYLSTENMSLLEKNWTPFEYNNELYFEYLTNPHVIIKCDINTGKCTKVYETSFDIRSIIPEDIGGGAPPQKIKIDNKSYYLGVAHIRADSIRKNFFYIFNTEPPFNIIKITKPIDILNASIEFASGLIIINDTIILSVGIDDCYSIIKKYKLSEISKLLINLYK